MDSLWYRCFVLQIWIFWSPLLKSNFGQQRVKIIFATHFLNMNAVLLLLVYSVDLLTLALLFDFYLSVSYSKQTCCMSIWWLKWEKVKFTRKTQNFSFFCDKKNTRVLTAAHRSRKRVHTSTNMIIKDFRLFSQNSYCVYFSPFFFLQFFSILFEGTVAHHMDWLTALVGM